MPCRKVTLPAQTDPHLHSSLLIILKSNAWWFLVRFGLTFLFLGMPYRIPPTLQCELFVLKCNSIRSVMTGFYMTFWNTYQNPSYAKACFVGEYAQSPRSLLFSDASWS